MTFVGVVESVGQVIDASGVEVIVIGGIPAAVAAGYWRSHHRWRMVRLGTSLGAVSVLSAIPGGAGSRRGLTRLSPNR